MRNQAPWREVVHGTPTALPDNGNLFVMRTRWDLLLSCGHMVVRYKHVRIPCRVFDYGHARGGPPANGSGRMQRMARCRLCAEGLSPLPPEQVAKHAELLLRKQEGKE